tara:strand:+ start:278 stop:442 length:165 start_codon:yes stop_codon:yes gene_type:complete
MVKKLKNKRKKFSVGGFTGASMPSSQKPTGSFSLFADQLTQYNLHKKGFIGKKK